MVAVKKLSTTRADLETVSQTTCPNFKEAKPPFSFAGFIFVCSNGTIPDLEHRPIFGLPLSQAPSVLAICKGMPLFLFNYSTRCLCGVFEAASNGGLNIDPNVWENFEVRKSGKAPVSRYPAQVRVILKFQRKPLDEETFRPLLDHIDGGHKFRLELTAYQVKQLLKLFSVAEEDFFIEKSKKWLQSAGADFLPESPRSAFKADSDCYSECSSKGTYCGEDEWSEEDRAGRETTSLCLSRNDQQLCDGVSRLSVSDSQISNYKVTDDSPEEYFSHDAIMPPVLQFLPPRVITTITHNQQSNLKRNTAVSPYSCIGDTGHLQEVSQSASRFGDMNPAVNSIPPDLTRVGVHQSESKDEMEPSHLSSDHLPAPFLGYENMIYAPVQPQSKQYMYNSLQTKASEKKLAGGQQRSKQALNSENYEKFVNSKVSKLYAQRHPIILQGPQYGQIFISPVCSGKPGPIYEGNQMSMISPFLLSAHGQGVVPLAHPQIDAPDSADDCEGIVNYPLLHSHGYHKMFHGSQFPVLILPSVMPRMVPGPIATGFIEALHFNIVQFARLTRPSAETQLFVESSIDHVRRCVRTVWPNADVEVFGSFATGLCLQHSDVDLAVVNAPLLPALVNMTTSQASSFLLRELGLSLKAAERCESYNVIANASVPVLKCRCRPVSDPSLAVPSIAIDITIGGIENSSYEWKHVLKRPNKTRAGSQVPKQHTGGAAREYVLSKIQELPALAPLVFVMKSFLQHRGLSNVYLGGLGSFSLTLLLAYYLERLPLSEENLLAHEDLSSLKMSSPGSNSPNRSEESEVPMTGSASLDEYYSNHKSECVNWSLGQHYVRKAAGVIERVLAVWEGGGVAYLGSLLLGFLRKFGYEHDLAREKIVLKGTDGSPGGIFKRDNRHIALWIDDPLRPGVNIAAGSFGMCQVQATFREMYLALTTGQFLSMALHCNERVCQDLAAFGQLSQLCMLLMEGIDQ